LRTWTTRGNYHASGRTWALAARSSRAPTPPQPIVNRYEGTAFVVTHDRDLISSFATRLFAFTEKGLVDFKGTYDEFLAEHAIDAKRR
jgi:hypothetical protein